MLIKNREPEEPMKIQRANNSKNVGNGKMSIKKISSLKNAGLLVSAREKIFNNFKNKIFLTKNLESDPILNL